MIPSVLAALLRKVNVHLHGDEMVYWQRPIGPGGR